MRIFANLNRQGVLWLAFFTLILAAWGGLFAMVLTSPLAGLPTGIRKTLCVSASAAGLPALFGMWVLMSAAMMLPTFVPALRTFLNLGATGATRPSEALALIAGYVLFWLGGAGLGALAQNRLANGGLLAPDGASVSLALTAVLLVAAGLYQFSLFKAACLAKCRMPLTFYMERWAPGRGPAFRMGVELGALCFGCCWALMALAFVGGTMSLLWMGAATLFMVLEKLPDIGRYLTRPAGVILIAAGAFTALSAGFGS